MKTPISFFLIFSTVFLIYSNTFDVPWHLDDFDNIVHDNRIHLKNLDLESLLKTTSALSQSPRDARPLTRLSFAANWFLSENDPFGYHLVNISIHFLAAFFLFLTLLRLQTTPNMLPCSLKNRHFIALMAAILWTINPIQTQAVTYIVQRMASLSAMFYIVGIYAYAVGRTENKLSKQISAFTSCFVCFVLGFASKENTATLPVALLLVEFAFFQDLGKKKIHRIFIGSTIFALFTILLLGVVVFFKGNVLQVLNYDFRFFSPLERLLTETRVLVFYLSQIFYPTPNRLSIEHDIILSTSIASPWTTLPSIIIVLGLIALGVILVKKRPVLGFAILFFFLNHMIESSIIGLELIFEHRNYLPSMFLFFPVAVGADWLLGHYRERSIWMYRILIGFITLIIIGYGFSTYVRNMTWMSGERLWKDAAEKAPNSSRPLHNLALVYQQQFGADGAALKLYHAALDRSQTNIVQKSMILNNIAAIYYKKRNYLEAAKYWEKTIASNPNFTEARYRRALVLMRLGKMDEALRKLDNLLAKHPNYVDAGNLKGIIYLNQGKAEQALVYFQQCLKAKPNRKSSLVNIGAAFFEMGHLKQAALFFRNARLRWHQDIIILLWLINTHLEMDNQAAANKYIDKLIDIAGASKVKLSLDIIFKNKISADDIAMPKFNHGLYDTISQRMSMRAKHMLQLSAPLPD